MFTDPLQHLAEIEKKAARASELQVVCDNLKQTLEQYNTEFAEVKNQGIHACSEYFEQIY